MTDRLAAHQTADEGPPAGGRPSFSLTTGVRDQCENLARHINSVIQADRTVICLVDPARRQVLAGVGAGNIIPERDLGLAYAEIDAGLAGLALRTRQPVLSLHAGDGLEPEAARARREQSKTGAVIVAPLVIQSETVGAVIVSNQIGQRAFSEQDVETLMTLATLAAAAIENVRLYEDAQKAGQALARRAVQLEISRQIGHQITSTLDLEKLLPEVVQVIQEHFGYSFVGIWLLSDQQESLLLQAGAGPGGELHGQRLASSAVGIVAGVCRTGQPRLVNDVRLAPDYLPLEAVPDVQAELAVPLRIGARMMGALEILSEHAGAFNADDLMVFQTLADQIATAIRNAQLYGAEQHRRHLAEALERAGRELVSSLDLREVPGRILEQLAVVVPYARGSILLWQAGDWTVAGERGLDSADASAGFTDLARRLFQPGVDAGRPKMVEDVRREPGLEALASEVDLSWLGVPLMAKGTITGLIALARPEAAAFTLQDATLASAFAGQAAIALENARLYDETSRFSEMLERIVQERSAELQEAVHTLEQVDKTKSRFIEVTAHELRTPLTLVKGYGAMLQTMASQQGPDTQSLVEGIMTGVNRLHEIINSMLDVAKIDSHSLSMRRSPLSFGTLAKRVESDFRRALAERKIRLEVVGMDALPVIEADPELLSKAFNQLVSNAIKYTPDDGTVTLSGRYLAGDEEEGHAIELVVSDTGVGIDPEFHQLIFEKFYQTGEVSLHSSGRTKFKGGGPGLGLAIVRGIVHAHGGKIWVESDGHDEQRCPGSHFHILLPTGG